MLTSAGGYHLKDFIQLALELSAFACGNFRLDLNRRASLSDNTSTSLCVKCPVLNAVLDAGSAGVTHEDCQFTEPDKRWLLTADQAVISLCTRDAVFAGTLSLNT